jgi:hypothetical protein
MRRIIETTYTIVSIVPLVYLGLVLQLRIMSARAVVCAAGGLLVAALPARARDDDLWIGRPLMEHEVGQQVLDLGHAQLDVRGAGRRPLFRGVCRARIAARNAWA